MSTVKERNFNVGTMDGKRLSDLPGIGKVYEERLIGRGYNKASDLYQKYLEFNGNECAFREWLKGVCGANSNHSNACFRSLNNHHGINNNNNNASQNDNNRQKQNLTNVISQCNPPIKTSAPQDTLIQNIDSSRCTTTRMSTTPCVTAATTTKEVNTTVEKKSQILESAIKNVPADDDKNDEYTIVGKRIAFQLKGMDERQKLIAEKLISDIMFYGRMGKLQEDVVIHFPTKTSTQYRFPETNNFGQMQKQTHGSPFIFK